MIANLSDRKFVIVSGSANLRRSFSGLFFQLQNQFGSEGLFNNVGYVFVNRRRNMFKCLYWENDGLAFWHKKLTKGTFANLQESQEPITFSNLLLFLHGFIPPENRGKNS